MGNTQIMLNRGVVKMKGFKLVICIVCAFVAIAAAVAAIVIFRNQIADFFLDMKSKIDEKKIQSNGEFEDYADV